MSEIIFDLPAFELSPAEKVLCATRSKWKYWMLRKLMPDAAWEVPPVVLGKIEKGAIIGSIKMELK